MTWEAKMGIGQGRGWIRRQKEVRRSGGRYASGLAAACTAAMLAIAGCGGSSSSSSKLAASGKASFYTAGTPGGTPVHGGTVTIDTPLVPSTFNPYVQVGAAQDEVYQVEEQLFEPMPVPGNPSQVKTEPALASSWSVSPNGLVYTFHIREGIRFSNGEPLTGEDVVFSLKKVESPTDTEVTVVKPWKKISLVAPMTVQLQLSKPQSVLPELLAVYQASIVPKRLYEREGGTAFGLHPVGTGPFIFKSATPGFTTVTEVRNPDYWRGGGQPYVNELVWNQVESPNGRILAVRSGAADVALNIPYGQVASLKVTPGVRMLVAPEWGASFAVFNRAKTPFNDPNVTKALLYATPREEIIKAVYKGIGEPSNSLWGKLKYWDSKVPLVPYDIAKAKELLKHSAVPNGFSMTISYVSGETEGELVSSILQSAWAQIGVHATIQSLPATTLYSDYFSGKTQFAVFPPEEGYSNAYNPYFISYYMDNTEPGWAPPANPPLLAKLEKARDSTSEAEEQKLYGELQEDTYEQEPMAMSIATLASLNLVSDSLHGFQYLPDTFMRMEQVWLQK
jgi:peptide/nickel transport system substrate-binding protein